MYKSSIHNFSIFPSSNKHFFFVLWIVVRKSRPGTSSSFAQWTGRAIGGVAKSYTDRTWTMFSDCTRVNVGWHSPDEIDRFANTKVSQLQQNFTFIRNVNFTNRCPVRQFRNVHSTRLLDFSSNCKKRHCFVGLETKYIHYR